MTDPNDLEVLWVEVRLNKLKLCLGGLLHTPKWDKLHSSVGNIQTQFSGIILCGDFKVALASLISLINFC